MPVARNSDLPKKPEPNCALILSLSFRQCYTKREKSRNKDLRSQLGLELSTSSRTEGRAITNYANRYFLSLWPCFYVQCLCCAHPPRKTTTTKQLPATRSNKQHKRVKSVPTPLVTLTCCSACELSSSFTTCWFPAMTAKYSGMDPF